MSLHNIRDIFLNKNTLKGVIGLFLISILIGSCFFSYVNKIVEEIVPEKEVKIIVQQRAEGTPGGNEVWIVQQAGEGKNDLFTYCNNGEKTGIWEYRDAKQYGYGNNILISHGNNAGSILTFYCPELLNSQLIIWKNGSSGIITLQVGNVSSEINLYSEVEGGELYNIFPFKESKIALGLKVVIYIWIFIGIFIILLLLYIFLYFGVKMPKWITREYNYKYVIILLLILYIYDVIQYKLGIRNFLEFGDQLYYWNLTNFFTNGKWDMQRFAAETVTFRGYLCNFIPFSSKIIGNAIKIDAVYFYFIFTAGAAAYLLGYVLPKLHELLSNYKIKVYQAILMIAVFVFFWNGMLTAVLMDLLSISCFMSGLMFFIWYAKEKKLHFIALSGALLAVSIMFRYNYLHAMIIIFLYIVCIIFLKILSKISSQTRKNFSWVNGVSFKDIGLGIIVFAVAFTVVCIPQIQINSARGHAGMLPYDAIGSWVEPDFTLSEVSANWNFTNGITGYPYVIPDKQVSAIKSSYSDLNAMLTTSQLFDMLLSRPADTLIYIGKKLFTGFDVKTNIVYSDTTNFKGSIYYLFSTLNYIILACGVFGVFALKSNKKEKLVFGFIFLTLILPQAYVHVEWRYFIVGYLSLYYFAIYKFGRIIEDNILFQKIVSGKYMYYLFGYVFLSQWISFTFYG